MSSWKRANTNAKPKSTFTNTRADTNSKPKSAFTNTSSKRRPLDLLCLHRAKLEKIYSLK